MKGERKSPTRMLMPRLNQLAPTFLIISILRISGGSRLWQARPLCFVAYTVACLFDANPYPSVVISSPHVDSILSTHDAGKEVRQPPAFATPMNGMSWRRPRVATHWPVSSFSSSRMRSAELSSTALVNRVLDPLFVSQ